MATVLVGLPSSCGARGPTANAPIINTEVEKAIRQFDRAVADSNAEALLQLITPAYFQERFTAVGVGREQLLATPDDFLGEQGRRRLQSIMITKDGATGYSWIKSGEYSSAAMLIRLTRIRGKWLVDHTGARQGPVPASAKIIELAMRDFTFEFTPSSFRAGRKQVIRARNLGAQPHVIRLWKVPEGRTPIKLIESTDTPPGEELVASTPLRPGERGDIHLNKVLQPGRYLLVCSLSDITVPEWTPHYDRGMVSDFKVQ